MRMKFEVTGPKARHGEADVTIEHLIRCNRCVLNGLQNRRVVHAVSWEDVSEPPFHLRTKKAIIELYGVYAN